MITRAAIYARKSTEQERGDTGDCLSVEEQIAGATAFIHKQGWTLGPIVKDEKTSGWTPGPRRAPRGHVLGDDFVPTAQSADPRVLRSPHPASRPAAAEDAGARGVHEQALALRLCRHESTGGVPTRSRLAPDDAARRVTPRAPARPERGACRPLSWDAPPGPAR